MLHIFSYLLDILHTLQAQHIWNKMHVPNPAASTRFSESFLPYSWAASAPSHQAKILTLPLTPLSPPPTQFWLISWSASSCMSPVLRPHCLIPSPIFSYMNYCDSLITGLPASNTGPPLILSPYACRSNCSKMKFWLWHPQLNVPIAQSLKTKIFHVSGEAFPGPSLLMWILLSSSATAPLHTDADPAKTNLCNLPNVSLKTLFLNFP